MKRQIITSSFLIFFVFVSSPSRLAAQTMQGNSFLSPQIAIENTLIAEAFSREEEKKTETLRIIQKLEKELPWKTLTRFAHFETPSETEDHRLKYWQNQFDMRTYMLEIIHSGKIQDITLDQFKDMLKKAHKLAAAGKNGDRLYKLRPETHNKESAIETGGEFRSGLPRTAETNNFEKVHSNIVKQANELSQKYGISDPFTRTWRFKGIIKLKDIPENALPSNQYYNLFENPYDAFIANDHPLWEHSDYYFIKMMEALKKCDKSIHDHKALIRNLSEFYQYSINLMPFESINNSLFMNIVNMFLEESGLKGIHHEHIDFAAFDLQQDTFLLYFYDKVAKENPQVIEEFDLPENNLILQQLLEADASKTITKITSPDKAIELFKQWIDSGKSRFRPEYLQETLQYLSGPNIATEMYLVEKDSRIAAILAARLNKEFGKSVWTIDFLEVNPEFKGQKIGQNLIKKFVARHRLEYQKRNPQYQGNKTRKGRKSEAWQWWNNLSRSLGFERVAPECDYAYREPSADLYNINILIEQSL